jgi:alkyl hydroperoxide reductase subunit AhpF
MRHMGLLSETDRQKLQEMLSEISSVVRLLFFTQTVGCETCGPAREILDEVVPLNDHLALEEFNYVLDGEAVAKYGIARVPAIAVVGERDYGIRFYGATAGYEFSSLLDAILLVARGESGLSEESRALVAQVDQPTSIQVFVTPT